MPLERELEKRLRGIGHALHPVVTVAGNGLSEGVRAELERALQDHELIKVKLALPDRAARKRLAAEMCTALGAQIVQEIGKVVLIFRRNPEADPRLSNLRRG
jgi:RNA-binding protein